MKKFDISSSKSNSDGRISCAMWGKNCALINGFYPKNQVFFYRRPNTAFKYSHTTFKKKNMTENSLKLISLEVVRSSSTRLQLGQTAQQILFYWNKVNFRDLTVNFQIQPEDLSIIARHMRHGRIGYILTLGVSHAYRQKGLGSYLLQNAMTILQQGNCLAVYLHVLSANTNGKYTFQYRTHCTFLKTLLNTTPCT